MITLVRFLLLLLLSTFIAHAQSSETTTVNIEIENISNDEGQLMIGLYNTETSWLSKPFKGGSSAIKSGKSSFSFTAIPNGVYEISVFHDEDHDGKLDTILGIPTEDTGSSNNAPARFGPPKWADAKFEVKGGTIKQIISL